jgi:hypothetical protein
MGTSTMRMGWDTRAFVQSNSQNRTSWALRPVVSDDSRPLKAHFWTADLQERSAHETTC